MKHSHARFAGAIHDTSDGTGDPQRFAIGLAEACRRLGVKFHLGTTITGLATDGSSVTSIATTDGNINPDIVVLAAGAASPLLTRTMGVRIPVYPAKGYTLTAAIKDPERAPHVGGHRREVAGGVVAVRRRHPDVGDGRIRRL